MTKQISSKIKVFNILMVLGIIAYHTGFGYVYNFVNEIIYVINAYFFMVSSYFFFAKYEESGFRTLIKKRACSLLVPFFSWNLIYFIYLLAVLGRGYLTLSNIVGALLVSPVCVPSWYLLALFVLFLLGKGIYHILNLKCGSAFLLVISVLISLGGEWALGFSMFNNSYAYAFIRAGFYLPAFIIGAVIGAKYKDRISVRGMWNLALLAVPAVFMLILLKTDISIYARLVIYNIFPVAIWMGFPDSLFGRLGITDLLSSPLLFLNLLHCFIITYVAVYIPIFGSGSVSGALLEMLFIVVTGYILYYLIKFLCPKLLFFLSGNR